MPPTCPRMAGKPANYRITLDMYVGTTAEASSMRARTATR